MRNLHEINVITKSTRHIFLISLIISIFMGCGAWALASGVTTNPPHDKNNLEIFAIAIILISILSLPLSFSFQWTWETKYFGLGLFPFSTGALMGIYPLLCIVLYSSLPIFIRIIIATIQFTLIIKWCKRFFDIYKKIYHNNNLFSHIYEIESDAVYFSQRADQDVLSRIFKFQQFPRSPVFITFLAISLCLAPYSLEISQFLGVPFIHIFLAIAATPLNLLFLGLCTKMWLVYYFYPMKIKRNSGMSVYVDMSSPPMEFMKKEISGNSA